MTLLDRARALIASREKATKGPWFWEYDEQEGLFKIYVKREDGTSLYLMEFSFSEDTKFAALAANDAAEIAEELLRVSKENQQLKKTVSKVAWVVAALKEKGISVDKCSDEQEKFENGDRRGTDSSAG